MFKKSSVSSMRQDDQYKDCAGFTLIEMSIVLIILSLLMGAVLKGQQLINISKVKQLESDFRNIPLMIYSYQDKFKTLPGDDSRASSRFSNAETSVKNGDGEGIITGSWFDFNPTKDNAIIWQHLRLAGLMSGETNIASTDYMPKNVLGKAIDIQSGTESKTASPILDAQGNAIKGSYVICSRGILGEMALSLDIRLDDGNPSSGSLLATEDKETFTNAAPASTIGTNTATDIAPNNQYIVCMGV